MKLFQRIAGCLIGGAVGDAMGAPIEFMSRAEILSHFGPDGLTDYAPAYGGIARITDDTQMTLFTADGLIRTEVRLSHKGITTMVGVTAHAYLRWLMTQNEKPSSNIVFGMEEPGWLYGLKALHATRAPGQTCLTALKKMKALGDPAQNNSKGCGGVMRMAPVGLWVATRSDESVDQECFSAACQLAGLTHGHPTGQLAAGVFAVLTRYLATGRSMDQALVQAIQILVTYPDHQETLDALLHAQSLAEEGKPLGKAPDAHAQNIERIGQGWTAEEALAISVYCALVAIDFEHGIHMAINHSGDSDSTGSMTGNMLGCQLGFNSIPVRWLYPLELGEEISLLSRDICHFIEVDERVPGLPDIDADETWIRYPGY
jgi:ADP-ribosylglycohydrolase